MTSEQRALPFNLGDNNRYEVTQLVAEGGSARIYMAFDTLDRAWRAVKILRPEYRMRTDSRKRMRAEAEALSRLRHPNILQVFEWVIWGEDAWIVMEFAQRASVGQWVESQGAMPTAAALEVARQVCVGVEFAHASGVIHRDIKPHNVLVDARGVCIVADFGIAAILDSTDPRLTTTGSTLGTLGYMAPEQFDSAKTVDERADVYSIGATLFHLLVAREPTDLFFTAGRSAELQACPPDVRQLVLDASRRKRADRFGSVAEMREAIEAVQEDFPASQAVECPLLAPPAPPPPPAHFGATVSPAGPPTFDLEAAVTVEPKTEAE